MKMIAPLIKTYPIVETFHSIQGEGAYMGVSAFFIRLAGCDVYCPWCDQKESWSIKPYAQQSIETLGNMAKNAKAAIIIITGGEPLIHDLNPLTKELRDLGLKVHLETSGSHPFTGKFDWVTFSPKPFKYPHDTIYPHVNELKIVIAQEKDLQWAEQQAQKVSPETLKYLQPEWNSPISQSLVFDYVLQHPEWRVSLQIHKFLGVQ
jgi:organic radical activating enzyme